jgi:hypothetical protein
MANESGTKAYALSLGRALNYELRRHGVHVSVLLPGPTDTPIVEAYGFTPESLPMKPMSVERCVSEALRALRRNRPSVLSGRLNRVLNALLPQTLLRAINAKMLGAAAKVVEGRLTAATR